ncbi:hypothetical protein FNQ90_17330 [Streptomyces alkaliphilus]|uniref:Uncharacterized protein n=1 Tax=Streptomyces alkaliphilus TaxID=1472722 RepID=A0A7W3TFY6_9ACTN|nr:hypothetical protein [Streptomyces alkaliphilus]
MTVPVGPNRSRALGPLAAPAEPFDAEEPRERVEPRAEERSPAPVAVTALVEQPPPPNPSGHRPEPVPAEEQERPVGIPAGMTPDQAFYEAFRKYANERNGFPNARQLSRYLHEQSKISNTDGGLLTEGFLRAYLPEMKQRYRAEMGIGV